MLDVEKMWNIIYWVYISPTSATTPRFPAKFAGCKWKAKNGMTTGYTMLTMLFT